MEQSIQAIMRMDEIRNNPFKNQYCILNCKCNKKQIEVGVGRARMHEPRDNKWAKIVTQWILIDSYR